MKLTLEELTRRAKADNRVIVLVVMPDGARGMVPLEPEFWAEKDELVGPSLVSWLKAGHEELLRSHA